MHAKPDRISRRVFIARSAGMTLTLGAPDALLAAVPPADPYSRGVWLAGDHHIHTKHSPDGQYQIGQQVRNALRHGLNWCVITDHGGPHHDKVAIDQAYPDLLRARADNPGILVFQGLEWNIPCAEHGSVILPPTEDEAERAARFEALYDEKNTSDPNATNKTEADAIAGVKHLQSLEPKPLFVANHPARRGLDGPAEMRAWSDAGPDVARGFEGAPGHQASTLIGEPRGEYGSRPGDRPFPGYPAESYRTWGGYDWYVAKVGGLWDSLLGEGRPWYITANSDSHRHYTDTNRVDTSTYLTKGFVTDTGETGDPRRAGDFFPGEYSKTWVFAERRSPLAVLDALRRGRMFTVLGGLVDRLEFFARTDSQATPMGGTLTLERSGEDVVVAARIRVPDRLTPLGVRESVHHLDIIAGDVTGPNADRASLANPSTRVVARIAASQAVRQGPYLLFTHRFSKVTQSFYVRLRGTNTAVEAPVVDPLTVNPWSDLWFYSNPVFVRVP